MSFSKVVLNHDFINRQFDLKIDGRSLSGVRSYEIKASVDEIPTITVELLVSSLEVNGQFDPHFVTLDTVNENAPPK